MSTPYKQYKWHSERQNISYTGSNTAECRAPSSQYGKEGVLSTPEEMLRTFQDQACELQIMVKTAV